MGNSLSWAFGDNAQQSATELIIQKVDIGVIPLAENTAESLLVGILVKVLDSPAVPKAISKRGVWGIKYLQVNGLPIKYTAIEFEFREVDNDNG